MAVAYLQGWTDKESAVRIIFDTRSREQIREVLFNEGERYRRFNRERFQDLIEQLKLQVILW